MEWEFEPKVRDIIETKPLRISKSGKVHGSNPTNYAEVVIRKKNLELVVSDEEKEAVDKHQEPFKFRSPETTHSAEIVEKDQF